MARKCHHHSIFTIESLFFEDYSFGNLMKDVFLVWFWTPSCIWKPQKQKSSWDFSSRLKILGVHYFHCLSKVNNSFSLFLLPYSESIFWMRSEIMDQCAPPPLLTHTALALIGYMFCLMLFKHVIPSCKIYIVKVREKNCGVSFWPL